MKELDLLLAEDKPPFTIPFKVIIGSGRKPVLESRLRDR